MSLFTCPGDLHSLSLFLFVSVCLSDCLSAFRMLEYQQQIANLEGDCRDLRSYLQVGDYLDLSRSGDVCLCHMKPNMNKQKVTS